MADRKYSNKDNKKGNMERKKPSVASKVFNIVKSVVTPYKAPTMAKAKK